MSGYILSVDAEFDLDDIWEYIAGDNIDAADRWIEKLFSAFEALGRTPGMGHQREDLTAHPVCSGRWEPILSFTALSAVQSRSWR